MTHRHLVTDPATAADFIGAGKAIFTLANTATGNHATYRVEAVKGEDDTFEVALFVGVDNTDRSAYAAIGRIEGGTFTCTLRGAVEAARDLRAAALAAGDTWVVGFCDSVGPRLAAGTALTERQAATLAKNLRRYGVGVDTLTPDAPKVRGFGWVKARVDAGKAFPEGVEFWTEGRCCTCGRRLTNPDSVHDLEGPVCKGRRGRALTGTVLGTLDLPAVEPEHEDA